MPVSSDCLNSNFNWLESVPKVRADAHGYCDHMLKMDQKVLVHFRSWLAFYSL